MAYKLDLQRTLKAIDTRNLDYYDSLSDEDKKAFSPYLMMRFAASNQSTNQLSHQICVQGVNELVNKNFDVLSKYPKLFWMLLAIGGVGTIQFHPWLKYKKNESDKKTINFLADRFPEMKFEDVEAMAEINDIKDLKKWAEDLGWDKKEIKAKLG